MATLYVVSTPIGNLEDITLRALRILKEVNTVLCEDTRVTRKLLSHYDIHTETMSFHAHSKLSKFDLIIDKLRKGENLALVTDAGTPAISDPGSLLIYEIQKVMNKDLEDEVRIVSIPGASALTAALSIAGMPLNEFIFYGFLPHKKGRETIFKQVMESDKACIFYESPHRIIKTLSSLVEWTEKSQQQQRIVCTARELTKIYEEVTKGTATEVLEYFTENKEKVRGEFVLIIGARV